MCKCDTCDHFKLALWQSCIFIVYNHVTVDNNFICLPRFKKIEVLYYLHKFSTVMSTYILMHCKTLHNLYNHAKEQNSNVQSSSVYFLSLMKWAKIINSFFYDFTHLFITLKIIISSLIFYCALNNAATQFMNSYFNLALNVISDKFSLSFIAEDKIFIEISK